MSAAYTLKRLASSKKRRRRRDGGYEKKGERKGGRIFKKRTRRDVRLWGALKGGKNKLTAVRKKALGSIVMGKESVGGEEKRGIRSFFK